MTDANLATGQQPFPRPRVEEEWLSPPIDQSRWNSDVPPFAWDQLTGLSQRPIPGQRNGEYVVTGLAHDQNGHVAYESAVNQHAMSMRSAKLATLKRTLKPPSIYGDAEGDLLVVGWGSTLGAIQEAVGRIREDGLSVSSLHLRFLSPLEPGLGTIFHGFKKIMTVEINYSDSLEQPGMTTESRRHAQLAVLLREHTLRDVDSWSRVPGSPIPPGVIEDELRRRLVLMEKE